MDNKKIYRYDLDVLKGIAIIAVILYHMGLVKSGYLGVDAFFVINGFLVIPSVFTQIESGEFNFYRFLERRLFRLVPLVLLLGVFCLIFGYFFMLPDDYENLSESIVASNFLSNNILSALTTNDYWASSNDYKPLMHTWYIGILFEFYLLFPLILICSKKILNVLGCKLRKSMVLVIIIFTGLSLCLYLFPGLNTGLKFYLLPARFFELGLGGLAGLWLKYKRDNVLYRNNGLSFVLLILLFLVLFFGIINSNNETILYDIVSGKEINGKSLIPASFLLLSTCFMTVIYVLIDNSTNSIGSLALKFKPIPLLGQMSYSLFIWHQPVLAFYRYCGTTFFSTTFILLFFICVFILSFFTYQYIEQKLKLSVFSRWITVIVFFVLTGFSWSIYAHAGVVRDVPELYVSKENVHRNMHAEYVDRIYSLDNDFPVNNKKNVLVIGNSFARDWANILLESKYHDSLNISYIFALDSSYIARIKSADVVFVFNWKHDIPNYLWDNIRLEVNVWGIGTKNFGESNGAIYMHRFKSDYYTQTVKINPNFYKINNMLKAEWGDKYIDLLSLSEEKPGHVKVFSMNHKYLSQDCHHLTKGGAQFYAKRINLYKYFE